MTRPQPLADPRMLVLAVIALALGLLTPAPADAGTAVRSDSQQHLDQLRSAHDSGQTADRQESRQPEGAVSACFADPTGDTVDDRTDAPAAAPRADIVEHCASYEDNLQVSVRVAEPTNPSTDPNWRQATFVGWFVDTTGDGQGDHYIDYSLDRDGALDARVLEVREDESAPTCDENVAASYDGTSYSAGPIPADCFGSPETVTVAVGVFYNDGGEGGPVYRDAAPDDGAFHGPLARDTERVCVDPLPAPFADRDDIAEVHRANVDCLFARGITLGDVRDGVRVFLPRPPVTRGQFSAFTFRTLAEAGVGLPEPQRPRFDDVPAGRVFDEEIHRLAAAGVLLGFAGTNDFGPQHSIRRDQTASVLVRAHDHATGGQLQAAQPGTHFDDIEGNIHAPNIDAAFEEGLVLGIRAPSPLRRGAYGPAGSTTRQQMASVLVRFLRDLEEDA